MPGNTSKKTYCEENAYLIFSAAGTFCSFYLAAMVNSLDDKPDVSPTAIATGVLGMACTTMLCIYKAYDEDRKLIEQKQEQKFLMIIKALHVKIQNRQKITSKQIIDVLNFFSKAIKNKYKDKINNLLSKVNPTREETRRRKKEAEYLQRQQNMAKREKEKKQSAIRNEAASLIQKNTRRHLARKTVHKARKNSAALIIQKNTRGMFSRKTTELLKQKNTAATLIQKNTRRHLARKTVPKLKKNNAALIIQKNTRGMFSRKATESLKQKNTAAIHIQKNTRRHLARKTVTKARKKNAALIIQKNTAAAKIQKNWRGRITRKKHSQQLESAITIQRLPRGYTARKTLKIIGEEAKTKVERQQKTSTPAQNSHPKVIESATALYTTKEIKDQFSDKPALFNLFKNITTNDWYILLFTVNYCETHQLNCFLNGRMAIYPGDTYNGIDLIVLPKNKTTEMTIDKYASNLLQKLHINNLTTKENVLQRNDTSTTDYKVYCQLTLTNINDLKIHITLRNNSPQNELKNRYCNHDRALRPITLNQSAECLFGPLLVLENENFENLEKKTLTMTVLSNFFTPYDILHHIKNLSRCYEANRNFIINVLNVFENNINQAICRGNPESFSQKAIEYWGGHTIKCLNFIANQATSLIDNQSTPFNNLSTFHNEISQQLSFEDYPQTPPSSGNAYYHPGY
jgi:hypothetical protein